MKRHVCIAVLLAAVALAAGCQRRFPVYNVIDAPVPTSPGHSLTSSEVHDAIVAALAAKRWRIVTEREGEIDARTNPRTHVADITIKYSATSYGIEYKDSVNLLYDETNIHRNYNKWIQLLREQIDAKLSNALWPPASGT